MFKLGIKSVINESVYGIIWLGEKFCDYVKCFGFIFVNVVSC